MAVESKISPLAQVRPEDIELGTVRPAVADAFDSRGLNEINVREKIVAENVVLGILRDELSDPTNPHALYLLRGQISNLLIKAIADFRKYQPKE